MNPRAVIIYDGVCGLCDRFVSFVIARDRRGKFRFAPQQGSFARRWLAANGRSEAAGQTVVVVTADGRLLERSRAVFFVLQGLSLPWRMLACLRWLPRPLLDWGYGQVAKRRRRLFGEVACRIPRGEERARFVADDAPTDLANVFAGQLNR